MFDSPKCEYSRDRERVSRLRYEILVASLRIPRQIDPGTGARAEDSLIAAAAIAAANGGRAMRGNVPPGLEACAEAVLPGTLLASSR